ncbi:MAG: glycosyltransferase family 2 protein [Candidatus Cloacimonetes bacterium]|nr:glycosyltransferase family 2 protein [Candidatus Cloacimonadota bacterium]
MKSSLSVSILVISHGHEKYLDHLLSSLLENQLNHNFEVVLVHNCESDYVVDSSLKSKLSIKEVYNPQIQSLSVNLNRNLKKCNHEYILILNPDTYLPKLNIDSCLKYLLKKNAHVVSCPSYHPKGHRLVNLRYFPKLFQIISDNLLPSNRRVQDQNLISLQQHKNSFWFQGSYYLCRKEIFDRVQFQEKYFLYFEDVQFCWDLWEKNLKLAYNYNTHYYHYFQQNSAKYLKYKLLHIRSYLLYFFS